MIYNSAFFGLFENVFKLLKKEYGESKAIEHFTTLMKTGLSKSYGDNFRKGDLNEFERIVGERDQLVGLRIEFSKISDNELLYRFLDDPFPNLKGEIDHGLLDHCYMNFKVQYLLGNDWEYATNKHIWLGDKYTEHRIFKK